jgi:hypothetical protein
MLKIIIGSLFTKNTKYAAAEKIRGTWTGWDGDGEANLFIFEG